MSSVTTQQFRISAVVGIALIVLLYATITSNGFGLAHFELPETRAWVANAGCWVTVAVVALYARTVEKRPFSRWEERRLTTKQYVLSVVVLLVFLTVLLMVVAIVWRNLAPVPTEPKEGFDDLAPVLSTAVFVFSAITAGVTEELLFRAYMLPRMTELFRSKWPAVLLSSILFGLAHYGQGDAARVVYPMIIGVVFSLYYERYRSLAVLIICHVIFDLTLF